jgi:glycosyltransferase involved in cell wall biosynthesis
MSVCLVAIAKNEARFLAEWLAHYLALGFDRIVVFDNESADKTAALLAEIGRRYPVERIPWPTPADRSPQVTAYNHAAQKLLAGHDWAAFFDCDEFLVLRQDRAIGGFLDRYDASVAALAVSWLTFGSSGRVSGDYGLVTDAFRRGGPRGWKNNRHYKTIVRPSALRRMGVHHAELASGAYIHPDGEPLRLADGRGYAARIDHSLAQLNHYQIKSKADFDEKVGRGRAGKKPTDPSRYRRDPDGFFAMMDRNGVRYDDIDNLRAERMALMAEMQAPSTEAREASRPAARGARGAAPRAP